MKLMTELVDGCVHAMGYCVDTEDVKPLEVARLENDALAAHALIQAMIDRLHIDDRLLVAERADELMEKWTNP